MHDNHVFTYALMPHFGSLQQSGVIHAAYELNMPPLNIEHEWCTMAKALRDECASLGGSVFTIEPSDQAIVETVKVAENDTGVVMRVYESFGGKCRARVRFGGKAFDSAFLCDSLENILDELKIVSDEDGIGTVEVALRPFQIASIFFVFATKKMGAVSE